MAPLRVLEACLWWKGPAGLGKLLALQVFSREASSRRGRSKRWSTVVGLLSQTLLLLCWWGSLGGWEDVSLSRSVYAGWTHYEPYKMPPAGPWG